MSLSFQLHFVSGVTNQRFSDFGLGEPLLAGGKGFHLEP